MGQDRTQLDKILGINIPEDAMSLGKLPSVTAKAIITVVNLKKIQEAILVLYQHMES